MDVTSNANNAPQRPQQPVKLNRDILQDCWEELKYQNIHINEKKVTQHVFPSAAIYIMLVFASFT